MIFSLRFLFIAIFIGVSSGCLPTQRISLGVLRPEDLGVQRYSFWAYRTGNNSLTVKLVGEGTPYDCPLRYGIPLTARVLLGNTLIHEASGTNGFFHDERHFGCTIREIGRFSTYAFMHYTVEIQMLEQKYYTRALELEIDGPGPK
jgi:hypothetical protein